MTFRNCLFAFCITVGGVTPAFSIVVNVGGIDVSAPGTSIGGRSVGEYTALWWKYVLEKPIAVNPLYDLAGERFAAGPYVADGVTFLYAYPPSNPAVPVTREVAVSAGTNLLMPLLQWVNLKTDPAETAADLLDQIAPVVAGTSGLFAEINGTDFASQTGLDLLSYRETFGLPGDQTFGVNMPASDAPFGLDGFSTDILVSDGHWLLLKNIPAGQHTLHFGGTNDFGESHNVTYLLTAVPEPASFVLLGLGLVGLSFVRRKSNR